MPLKKLLVDIPFTVEGNKAMFDITDLEELQCRYIDAQIDAAIRESEEHYTRTGIKHDGKKLLAELREKFVFRERPLYLPHFKDGRIPKMHCQKLCNYL